MKVTKIDFAQVNQFSKRDKAYISGAADLRDFYKYDVNLAAFEAVISDKKKDQTDRALLFEVLENQYATIGSHPLVAKNITLLKEENCFTVTTAHQPSLFFGPLYYVYKIISTIHLSRQLASAYPDFHFVPVFISGAEDHDFEEINHAHLFNKTLQWKNEEIGSVGKMSVKSLAPVLRELKEILGDAPNATKIWAIINNAYTSFKNYGTATVKLVHEIFKAYGLVVLDMNRADLKRAFKPIMADELLKQSSSKLVAQQILNLEEVGYKAQATPRNINLFYIKNNGRNRIVKQGEHYGVVETDIIFTPSEIRAELENFPEHFSPNVILRPLYQELILPNLAYIGGGGELAYWLERKTQFEYYNINFPMLIRRNSVLWIDKNLEKKRQKVGLDLTDIFQDTAHLIKNYVNDNANVTLKLDDSKIALENLFKTIEEQAAAIDITLVKTVKAELARQLKGIGQLESKMLKAEKQKHEGMTTQISNLKAKLFPQNGLQERHDNFLAFYLKHGDAFFEELLKALNPLEKKMFVFRDLGNNNLHT